MHRVHAEGSSTTSLSSCWYIMLCASDHTHLVHTCPLAAPPPALPYGWPTGAAPMHAWLPAPVNPSLLTQPHPCSMHDRHPACACWGADPQQQMQMHSEVAAAVGLVRDDTHLAHRQRSHCQYCCCCRHARLFGLQPLLHGLLLVRVLAACGLGVLLACM